MVLQCSERAGEPSLDLGAEIVALGRSALANPGLPQRVRNRQELRAFYNSILCPIANIKHTELAFEQAIS